MVATGKMSPALWRQRNMPGACPRYAGYVVGRRHCGDREICREHAPGVRFVVATAFHTGDIPRFAGHADLALG